MTCFRASFCLAALTLIAILAGPRPTIAAMNPLRQGASESVIPPDYLPTPEALSRVLRNEGTLEALSGGFFVALPGADVDAPTTDPHYSISLDRAVYVYAFRREVKRTGLFRVVTIHHTPEDREYAQRTARLCARLLRLHRERFGLETVFPRATETADVWLCPNPAKHTPKAGGETRTSNVYVWGTTTGERTALEWVRTVAHEWGHLTLPAARGYTEPESDASGYLGERLQMKWMRDEQGRLPLRPEDGTDAADLAKYCERQVLPLTERFQENGPTSRLLRSTSAEGMDYYIGAALAFDDSFGSRLLGRALFSIDGMEARDLLDAMSGVVAQVGSITVRLPAWVPLPKMSYTISGDTAGSVALADRPPLLVTPNSRTPLPIKVPGWKWVRPTAGTVRAVTLRRAVAAPTSAALLRATL